MREFDKSDFEMAGASFGEKVAQSIYNKYQTAALVLGALLRKVDSECLVQGDADWIIEEIGPILPKHEGMIRSICNALNSRILKDFPIIEDDFNFEDDFADEFEEDFFEDEFTTISPEQTFYEIVLIRPKSVDDMDYIFDQIVEENNPVILDLKFLEKQSEKDFRQAGEILKLLRHQYGAEAILLSQTEDKNLIIVTPSRVKLVRKD